MSLQDNTLPERLNVFLVDDDEDDYLITRDMLSEIKNIRFNIDWVQTYAEAYEQIIQNRHDVYLIDYRIAGNTGMELLQNLQSKNIKAPLILLTGVDDREVDMQAMAAGASDFLIKGQITVPLLDRSIRYAISQKKALDSRLDSEKRKEMFVATLTHDLKTPIRAEHRILEMLIGNHFGGLNETQAMMMDELLKSNQFMNRIVDNLLTAYKFDNDQIVLKRDVMDINSAVTTLLESELDTLLTEREIDILLDLDDSIPAIEVDSQGISKVLYHLLHNALTFTQKHGEVRVVTRHKGTELEVEVLDNGPGIEATRLSNIFEPFNILDKRIRQVGSGMGLYTSKRIIDSHGGKIFAENRPERGTSVVFRLPYKH